MFCLFAMLLKMNSLIVYNLESFFKTITCFIKPISIEINLLIVIHLNCVHFTFAFIK